VFRTVISADGLADGRSGRGGLATRRRFALLVLLALLEVAGCGRSPDLSRIVLTNASQVRRLSESQLRLRVPVRIKGIITYSDRLSRFCFIQDSTGGIRVGLAPEQIPPAAGLRVEAAGVAASGDPTPAVVEAHLATLGAGVLTTAVPLAESHLRDPAYQYKRVAIPGVVRAISSERPGLMTVEITLAKGAIWAEVPASITQVTDDWIDAEVTASGVLAESLDAGAGPAKPTLWVSDVSAIRRTRAAPPPADLPVSQIRSLLVVRPDQLPAHRVRVRGTAYVPTDGDLAVTDDGGQIPVRLRQAVLDPNMRIFDAAGFLVWEHDRPVLDQATPVAVADVGEASRTPAPGSTLTTAREVHQLPQSVARRAYSVCLHAVVTYFDAFNHLLFVQDSSDGIFVELSEQDKVFLRAGDRVEVTGVTTADFAPDVGKARVRVLGHPGLPAPKIGSFGNANWGREDCHWLELGGTVQRVAQGAGDTLLTMAWGKNTYKAHVLASVESLARMVDAEVTLRGVCGALFNRKRQMLGIQMFLPGAECIRVVRPAGTDLFSVAPTPIADLLQFSPTHDMAHRVRIRGTVTYANRYGSTWIRDATGGVMIKDHDAAGLAVGDLVDVAGFPEIGGFGPVLGGSRVQRLQSGVPPLPVRVAAEEALKGDFDGQLIEIEGKLVDRLQQPAEQVLAVKSGETIFNANLPGGGEPGLEPGTRVRLTGICSVETEQSHDLILPRTFRLLLRSGADVVIVGRPPIVTAERVVPALAGALLLIVAALAWAALLRRRVRAQTFALRAQTVQLQAAHQKTRDALRKACEAESLDLDSKRILERIARDEPVDLIIDLIAEAVVLHCEGAVCAILVEAAHGARVCVVPAMPASWLEALRRIELRSISCGAEFREPKQFSDDPAWVAFIEAQPKARFRAFCAAPIILDGGTAGVIAAFQRMEKSAVDLPGAELGLWCNVAALALERRRLHDQLSYRAQYDGLTGLPNRTKLYETLEAGLARAARGGELLGLLYIDLDGFKKINDTYGHDAGDEVLQEAARRMTLAVRRGDMVARIGGDEFIVLLPLLARREDAQQVADKIAEAMREPIYSDRHRFSVCASTGVAIGPVDGNTPDALLRFADAQMYGEKRRRWYERPGDRPAPPERPVTAPLSRPEEVLTEVRRQKSEVSR
jgi:diguanylate cyclase (GGDEF)-like protein